MLKSRACLIACVLIGLAALAAPARAQDFYKGNYGRVAGGFEWEYVRRNAFPGYGGCPSGCTSPSTSDNVFMTSLRWYPF